MIFCHVQERKEYEGKRNNKLILRGTVETLHSYE
jgi:hypothetical protein